MSTIITDIQSVVLTSFTITVQGISLLNPLIKEPSILKTVLNRTWVVTY